MKTTIRSVRLQRLEDLGVILLLGVIAGFFLYPPMRTEPFWRGERGWLEVLGSMGTVAAASAAAYFAFLTFKASRKEAVDTRFQKAAELLGNANAITAIGGIYALRDIVNIDSGRYYLSGVQLLLDFIDQRCTSQINGWNGDAMLPGVRFSTLPEVKTALAQVSLLRTSSRRSEYETGPATRFEMGCLVLSGLTLKGINLARVDVSKLIVGDIHIYGSDFSEMRANIFRNRDGGASYCNFDECSFAGGVLTVINLSIDHGATASLSFHACDMGRATTLNQHGPTNLDRCMVELADFSGTVTLSRCWYKEFLPGVPGHFHHEAEFFPIEERKSTGTTQMGMPTYSHNRQAG